MSCPKTIDELDDQLSRPDPKVLAAVDACPGNIAVLGAGGKMGFHTARMLQRALEHLGRREPVVAVSRFTSESSREPFQRYGIETIQADLSDAGQVASLPNATNLFFLAGVKFGTSDDVELLYRMNSLMPQLVAERFAESRIVALSTGCVYSFTSAESGGSTEQSETDPPGDYAKSCLLRERAFIDGSQSSGTPCSLVRLNYSVELRYGVLVDIATRVFAGQPVSVDAPYVNVIWQRDAVSQIVQCLPCAQSPPFIVNITGPETLSVRDLADRFGKRFGKPVTFTGQEADTCWLSNSSLARGRFGDPPMELDLMIEWIAEWIEAGRETLGKPTKFHVRDGKY
jgi:nucleoside-diphosphate-sugar epimerase